MNQRWDDYEKAADHGPLKLILKVVVLVAIVSGVIGAVSFGFGIIGGTADVARQEFGAKAALQKYEWFKDAAAQLQKKQADIQVYEVRQRSLVDAYGATPRREWSRVDQEAWTQAVTELAGVKASYNMLAAEYNAASSKFNWRGFAGDVPQTIQPLIQQ